jgi:hypothetical protein
MYVRNKRGLRVLALLASVIAVASSPAPAVARWQCNPWIDCFVNCPGSPNSWCSDETPPGCTYTNGTYSCGSLGSCVFEGEQGRRWECPYDPDTTGGSGQ